MVVGWEVWGPWGEAGEEFNSSVCIRLETEPPACQENAGGALIAGSRRQPWRRTRQQELTVSEGPGIYCCSEPLK